LLQQTIVGGEEITPNSRPYLVQIGSSGSSTNQRTFCGGSILNSEWILTAAHCFEGRTSESRLRSFRVTAAEHNIKVTETVQQRRGISQAIIHPNYDSSTLNNDVALLKLDSPLTITAEAAPIPLNTDDACPLAGATCSVAGWGTLSSGGSTPDAAQAVNVTVKTNAQCDSDYPREDITEGMICAGDPEGGKDSCQGDSGGPFVCTCGGVTKQVGVVSWGYGCALRQYPGVYARVSKYVDWIRTNVPDFCDPQ